MPTIGSLTKKTVNSLTASYFTGYDPSDTTQTLSGTTVTWPASAMNTYVWSNSANYNIDKISPVYTTVNSNSATTWNYQGTDVKSLTANWQNTYTNFSIQSAHNTNVYTTVNSNSAGWIGGGDININTFVYNNSATILNVDSVVQSSSANWNGVYTGFNLQSSINVIINTVVQNTSASWAVDNDNAGVNTFVYNNSASILNVDLAVQSGSANWQNTYTNFAIQSANNASVYATVNSNSAVNWNYQGTDVKSLTSNWQNTYTTVKNTSASWGGGGGGNATWTLISTTTISSPVATVAITGLTGHRKYMFEFENLYGSADGYAMFLQVSTDGGSTWDSGASDYDWSRGTDGTYAPYQGTGTAAELAYAVGNGSTEGVTGELIMFAPNDPTLHTWYEGWLLESSYMANTVLGYHVTGRRRATSIVDSVRFYFATGNISGGKIRLFSWTE